MVKEATGDETGRKNTRSGTRADPPRPAVHGDAVQQAAMTRDGTRGKGLKYWKEKAK
jgi:hypothetical protein